MISDASNFWDRSKCSSGSVSVFNSSASYVIHKSDRRSLGWSQSTVYPNFATPD